VLVSGTASQARARPMINRRGQKPSASQAIVTASPMSRALLAAGCSCRPNCRPFIATLKRPS
jgi:hypothetical protein